MDVFKIISDWYAWLISLPVIAILVWAWKNRAKVQEHFLFWWNLKSNIEKALAEPKSPEAKFCPDCDQRMKVVSSGRFDIWWYKCFDCDKAFQYPAPTAPK